ncbi:RsiV family protein [Anaerocolumna xylanovorans]|uniref:DUF3298 domain-containing protein n=1 Tax=Anaerocolumna xylanovorans DSM 12503 TaxID=1121345 RepID=A0A1M7Y3T6_9FIRM|nr:RsiV family protein [Anaerocolumna xylanovorans]SHO46653.1 Protein of unknown function [Anaerocolumna xylanovorans DSM 12503]
MNISDMKKDYENTPIPDELDFIVRKTLKKEKDKMKFHKLSKNIITGVAAAAALFVLTVNVSPAAANAMADVPVLTSLVKVVTFREYTYKDDHHEADVKVPQVTGLDNKDLENHLNEKYLEENTKLYKDFLKNIGTDNLDKANLALFTDYKVILDTDSLLVMASEKTEIAASGSESVHYDTIDKKNQMVLTLSSLFKDSSYIDVISKNIISQMKDQMAKDEDKMYFIADGTEDGFKTISADQNFYINKDGKLVISFNEYDVAPGVMGIVEFIIPTEVIKDILVSDYYVK